MLKLLSVLIHRIAIRISLLDPLRPDLPVCVEDLALVNCAENGVTCQARDLEVLQITRCDDLRNPVLHDFGERVGHWDARLDNAGKGTLASGPLLLERKALTNR